MRYSWSIKSPHTKKIQKLKLNIKKGGTKKILKFIKNTEERSTRNIRKIRKTVTRLSISCKKQNRDPIMFAQYVIKASICVVSDYLSKKNIIFSMKNCIIQWNYLIQNCIYVKPAINILLKMKFHAKQSAIKWHYLLYQTFERIWKN